MPSMFKECSILTTLNLGNIQADKAEDMSGLFEE